MILAGITPLIRKPKDKEKYRATRNKLDLNSFLRPIVDELIDLFDNGFYVEDYSQPEGSPLRKFNCRVILLSTPMDHKAAVKVSSSFLGDSANCLSVRCRSSLHWLRLILFRHELIRRQTGTVLRNSRRREQRPLLWYL